jgi:hypothetical protein
LRTSRASNSGAIRPRLEDLRLAALELRVSAELELGMHAQVVEELASLCVRQSVPASPLREKLMLALYAAGRQAEASPSFARRAMLSSASWASSRANGCATSSVPFCGMTPSCFRESRDREPSSRRVLVCGRPEELRDLARLAAPFALDELIVVGVSVEPELAATHP